MGNQPERPFETLERLAQEAGFRVLVTTGKRDGDDKRRGLIRVVPDEGVEGEEYSRWVEDHESYDRAAKIVLEALQRSKVLPDSS